jgi:hypothetical protein
MIHTKNAYKAPEDQYARPKDFDRLFLEKPKVPYICHSIENNGVDLEAEAQSN